MKAILIILAIIVILATVVFLLPVAICGAIGYFMIDAGNIAGGVILIVIGLAAEVFYAKIMFNSDILPAYSDEDDCPYCGSGDTDGNHCYTCDDDF